jgi:hypothetical protein
LSSQRLPATSARRPSLALAVVGALGAVVALGSASCGGSSSETPPPLEPLPANVHYNRSATTLPGELGTKPAAEPSGSEAAPVAPAPKHAPAH